MTEETEFKPRHFHPSNVRRSRGKMHGQFASAGWNKWYCKSGRKNNNNQEPVEQTKKVTGRAKKRQQNNHKVPEKSPEELVEVIENREYSRELSHINAVDRRTWYNGNYTYRAAANTKKPKNIEYRNNTEDAYEDIYDTEDEDDVDEEEWTVVQRSKH